MRSRGCSRNSVCVCAFLAINHTTHKLLRFSRFQRWSIFMYVHAFSFLSLSLSLSLSLPSPSLFLYPSLSLFHNQIDYLKILQLSKRTSFSLNFTTAQSIPVDNHINQLTCKGWTDLHDLYKNESNTQQ